MTDTVQMLVKMRPELRSAFKDHAEKNGFTISQLIRALITDEMISSKLVNGMSSDLKLMASEGIDQKNFKPEDWDLVCKLGKHIQESEDHKDQRMALLASCLIQLLRLDQARSWYAFQHCRDSLEYWSFKVPKGEFSEAFDRICQEGQL